MRSVKVNRKAADRIASGHPWIFASDIVERAGVGGGRGGPGYRLSQSSARHGSLQFFLPDHTPAAFQPGRRYRSTFLTRRLAAAIESPASGRFGLRRLSGRVLRRRSSARADRRSYGDYLSMQTLNQGMDRARRTSSPAWRNYSRRRASSRAMMSPVAPARSCPSRPGSFRATSRRGLTSRMNGLRWHADLWGPKDRYLSRISGRITSLQRDTRAAMRSIASLRPAASLCILRDPASMSRLSIAPSMRSVGRVQSRPERNHERDLSRSRRFRRFDRLRRRQAQVRYGRARSTGIYEIPTAIEGAARGYKEINQRALRLLDSGGVLVTCSCSHHFSEAMLSSPWPKPRSIPARLSAFWSAGAGPRIIRFC